MIDPLGIYNESSDNTKQSNFDPLGIYEAPKSKEDQQSDRLFNDLVKEQHNAAPSNNPSSSAPAMQVGPQKTTYVPNLMGGPLGVISIDRGNNKISNVEDNASPSRVLGTIAGSMAVTPGAGVEAATKLIPRISTDPNAPWYKLEPGSLKEAQQTLDKRMSAMNFIKTPEDAQGLEALNKVMSYIPEKAGKGLGMVGQIINNALKDPNMPQDEDPIPVLEPFLSSIGEVSATFGLFGIFDEIKNSTAYRQLTIPERRIIIKDFADTMKKNPNMSEGDLLRKAGPGSDLWNAKLNELRVKSEPTDLTDQIITKKQEITPEPSPVEPIDLTDLKSGPTKPVPKAEPEPQPTPEEINQEAQKFMGEEVNLTDEEAKLPLSQEEIDNASRLRENQGSEIPEESGQLGSQTSQGEYVQGNEGPPIQERPGIGGQNMELQPEQSARGEGQQLAPELDPLNINGNIDIDQQAHQAATSPQNETPEPTPAQVKAGNYKKGKIKIHGLDISIENPKGSIRKGISKSGKPWKNEMTSHYGYIRRTVGGENEQLDVFVGPKPESEKVYVVKQMNPNTNKFDENKVLMGYENEKKARIGYLSNYKKGWKGLGSIQEFSINEFKDWLKNGDQTKPAEKNNVEIPELNSTEDAIAFSKVASDAQLKRVDALREEVEAQRKKIMDEAMAANKQGKRAKANELINEGTRLATRAQLLRETLEAKAEPGRMENTARSGNENLSSSEKSIDEVINNPKASQKEVIAEKTKLKNQVVAGIKSGEFDGAVRFGTVDEIKSILKNGYMPVSSEYGAIHAQPILGKNDDVFAAYGSYEKHNMALVFPKDSIIKKTDAHTKEVLIDSNVDVKRVKFLIDGHKKIYSFNELKDAINSKNAPGSTISPKPVQEVAGGEVQPEATAGRGENIGEKIPSEKSTREPLVKEPPIPKGMTRLYHGSATNGRVTGPAWFSTNKKYAKNYREDAELQYVDYPTEKVNQALDPNNYGQTVEKGFTWNVELDSSETGPRKILKEKKVQAQPQAMAELEQRPEEKKAPKTPADTPQKTSQTEVKGTETKNVKVEEAAKAEESKPEFQPEKKKSNKPRLAENESDLWKAITDKTDKGVVSKSGRIEYPVVRIIGEGDFRVTSKGIEKIKKSGMGLRDATKAEISDLEDAIKTDTAMVLLKTGWGGARTSTDSDVLHSPSGNSFKSFYSEEAPKSAPQSTKEETKATTPGMVRLDKGGVKPFTEYREIKRGKDSGKIEITLATGKKVKVQPEQIREYPSQESGKKYSIQKTRNPDKILWRGEDENTGKRTATLGYGTYFGLNKNKAKSYGMPKAYVNAYPKNPLILGNYESLDDWILKNTKYKNIRDFGKDYTDPGKYLQELGYDGVVSPMTDEVVNYKPEDIRSFNSLEEAKNYIKGKKFSLSKAQKEKLQGVTKQDIQKAFPGSKTWQNIILKFDDKSITGFFVELPNGKQLLIDPQNDFIVGDIDQIAKDYGQTPDEIKRKFASDEARINGAFTPRNGVSLIELASWSDPGDLSHEKFHFLFNLLKREDRANIFKKYGSEEKAAEAFRIKENYTKSFWEKILHTLRRIKDKIFGDVFKPIFDKLKEDRGSISFKNKNAENVESWINEKGTKENQISTPEEESKGLAKLYTPGLEKILEPFKEIKGSLESLLIPTNKSPEHLKAAEVLGKNLGSMGRDAEIANNTLKDASKLFNRLKVHDPNMPDNQNPGLKFMSDMSMGRRMSDAMNKLKIMANTFFKDRLDKLEAADVPLQTVRENYFPGMWTWESRRAFNQAIAEALEKYPVIADKIHMLSDKQKAVIKNRVNQLLKQGKGSDKNGLEYLSKRPFKGKESFRKQKVFDDIMSGIDLGLRPISNNPIDIIRLKLAEMDRSIMANRAIKEWKEKGDIQFLKSGKNIPEGFAKIDDRYGTVYGPPEVLTSEYVDQNIYNALSETAKNLGISHQRKMNAGRGRLGAYSPLEGIKTQYATELGIFGHEIGHALDQKYNLWNSIVKDARGIGKRGNITKGATQKLQATIQNELRALSDLTWEGKAPSKYFKQKVRTKAEKIAHILEAYTQAPERLMEVAPHVYDAFEKFLKSVPELKPLTEIKAGISYKELQNKINIGGFPIIGQWIAKEAVADVLNNYLSSPLYNNKYIGKVFSAYMGTANLLNQFQLGIGSAFHAGFTTGEAITSQTAGMYKDLYGLIKGNRSITDLYKTTKRIPIGFILNPMEGSKILNEWISPTIDIPIDQKISELPSDNPTRIAMITKAAELAGGGFKMERGLRTDLFQDINKDLNSGMKGKIKLGLKSPFIFSEVMAKPIIDILVPRQKAGIFGELAGRIIDMNPDKTLEELIPEFRQAWNRVDARLGQVRYNRLFIKNWSKNIVQALIRAPGWTGGTIAEIGGSIKDTGKFLNEWVKTKKMPENMPDRIAYTMALFTVFGILGGLLTYAFTGEKPQGKDFWAFRTGGIDEYGRPERMVLPSYMKDVWAYSRNPKEVILNKTHPLIGLIKDIAQNEDYYGVKIYNEDDPFIIRQIEKGQYILKQFTPFWLRGAKKESDRSGGFLETLKKHPMKLIGPEFGVMPAPSTYTRSEFEDWAFKISREKNRGLRTKKQFEKSQVKRQLEMALRRKDKDAGIKLNDALKNGSITYRDKLDIQRKAKEDPIEKTAKYLSLENLAYGIQYANDKELLKIIPIFRKKYINKISNRSMSQEDRLRFRNILDNLNQKYNELKRNQK